MICKDIGCPKLQQSNVCSVYTPQGQLFRNRMGYCPIPDDGPNKKVKAGNNKSRVGQQKQKKK